LNSRLGGVRKLKAALEPLYQLFGAEQKQMADKLLLPPMIGHDVGIVHGTRETLNCPPAVQRKQG